MTDTPRLGLEITTDADQIVCVAVGEIDPGTAPDLDGEMRTALFSSAATTMVLDLSGVTFVDSAGLRVLIDLYKLMTERDGRLVLRKPNAVVSRLLEITNLTERLDIEA